ncbi:hypothetical protein N7457_005927 [Penicillium paradoxum]|uniref:uncharacterized protein n=1 Tax=Penicillium paradoxum TaxID=176176 RepID=UPI0025476ACE|nr:uncharacterized protein N7457_005927 [Penicillium paradoxum]KAJ5780767.1 hypothetical protein N7457_005927 [Penicillium paradoxum]
MAFVTDQFFPQMDETNSNEWVDFDQFLDLPQGYDDQSTATTVSPQDLALHYETNEILNSPFDAMYSSFDMINYDLPQEDFVGMDGSFMQVSSAPLFDDAAFFGYNPYDSSNTFRNLVEAQAAADPRVASLKEKRREASIALHLQRLCEATALDLDMSSDSNTSFSSPEWSGYVRGMQMVLDLNMNAAVNVPKKQKPRSQAQKENYIKARKYGACEKHKKQHKRCNCLEKAAARTVSGDVPMDAALQERPRQQQMLQVPILPVARYSSSPGHDPSIDSPQALPATKAIRKPANRSSGPNPSMETPAGLPLAVPIPGDIIKTQVQKSTPPGHHTVFSTGKTPKNVPGEQPHDPCLSTALQSVRTSRKPVGSASLRWRISTSSSLSFVPSEGTDLIPKCSTNHPITGVGCTSGLDVRWTRSTRTVDNSVLPGTVAGNLGICYSRTATRNSTAPAPGQDHKKNSGLSGQLAMLSGQEFVQKHLLVSPSRRGSPTFSGTESSVTRAQSTAVLVQSVAESVGGLVSRTASAVVNVWQSSLALTSGSEDVISKCLSLLGRNLMSAKKGLYLGGLRAGHSGRV